MGEVEEIGNVFGRVFLLVVVFEEGMVEVWFGV